jgi:APA family basic amino acid/polyamine antiporter
MATATALTRVLTLRDAVAIGVGGTVGGGVYVLIGAAAGAAGPAALAALAIAFAAAALIALPYAELACRAPLAGGGYAFAREVLGTRAGFVAGWVYWGAYLFVSGYVTLGFGGYLADLTGLPTIAGAALLIGACLILNLRGVKVSARAQAIVIGTAVLGLAAFVAWGLPSIDTGNLTPFAPHGASGLLNAALLAFLAFGGFDMVAAAGEEIEHPDRNLPRAILLTLALVLALYSLVTLTAIGTYGSEALGDSSAPLADAGAAFGGESAHRLVTVAALLTTAATTNAVLLVTSRVTFAMARDRLLPSRLAHLPVSLTVNAALLAAVALTGSVTFVAAVGGFLYAIHFVPPLVALILLRRRSDTKPAAFTTPAPNITVALALTATAVLAVASGTTGIAVGGAWLVLGALAAVGLRESRSSLG